MPSAPPKYDGRIKVKSPMGEGVIVARTGDNFGLDDDPREYLVEGRIDGRMFTEWFREDQLEAVE